MPAPASSEPERHRSYIEVSRGPPRDVLEDGERATRLRVTPSIRSERLPRPGPVARPWAWDDVLEAPPPSVVRERAERVFALRHGFDGVTDDPEVRVGYATVVAVRSAGADTFDVHVDERIAVEPRVLPQVLVAERALQRRMAAASAGGARMVAQGSVAIGSRMSGAPARAVVRGGGATAAAWIWVNGQLRSIVGVVARAPDEVAAHARAADVHLSRPRERRALIRNLAAPHELSREQKGAALFLVFVSAAALLLVAHLGITFTSPAWTRAWRELLGFFVLTLGSTVIFPFFPETRLNDVIRTVSGPTGSATDAAMLAIGTGALAMLLGAWIVLLLGDEIHGALRRGARTRPRLARALDRAETLARKHGFWTPFLVLSIPLGPDTVVFYLLASIRTPVHKYLAAALLGSVARFTIFHLLAGA